jgi:O-acetylhomoserine/O-acetylserine sulfhydrylase-like pyridoxal-dependent enzyme
METFQPMEKHAGIVKHSLDFGKFIQGLNKGLYPALINSLKLIVSSAQRHMVMGAQDKVYASIHLNPPE